MKKVSLLEIIQEELKLIGIKLENVQDIIVYYMNNAYRLTLFEFINGTRDRYYYDDTLGKYHVLDIYLYFKDYIVYVQKKNNLFVASSILRNPPECNNWYPGFKLCGGKDTS